MNQSAAARVPARPAPSVPWQSPGRVTPPRLRVVAPGVGTSRARLAALSIGMLVTGLVTLLMVTIDLGAGAYTLAQLQREHRELGVQRQALTEQVQAAQAPQALARRAGQLGMVPAPNTAFLQVPSGRLVGRTATASAPVLPKKPVAKKPVAQKKPVAKKPVAQKKPAAASAPGR